jgi:hypothetical protein
VRDGHGLDEIEGAPQLAHGETIPLKLAQVLACPVRLRPILMTSVATVVAALPLAIDHSPGFEARMPMALAIIGGNCVSTLFTLYVVPCAYNLLAYFETKHQESEHDLPVHRGTGGSGGIGGDDHGGQGVRVGSAVAILASSAASPTNTQVKAGN